MARRTRIEAFALAKEIALDPRKEAQHELSGSDRIRIAFLRGDTLSTETLPDARARSLFTVQMAEMRKLGFVFASEKYAPEEGSNVRFMRYTLMNPDHLPTEAHVQSVRDASNSYHADARRRQRSIKDARGSAVVKKETKAVAKKKGRTPKADVEQLPDFDSLPERPAAAPLPALGDQVTVIGELLSDDGDVHLILKNGTRAWRCRLEATHV